MVAETSHINYLLWEKILLQYNGVTFHAITPSPQAFLPYLSHLVLFSSSLLLILPHFLTCSLLLTLIMGLASSTSFVGGRGDPFTYTTIEVPTVVGLLHNILTQYPDNGQIIKVCVCYCLLLLYMMVLLIYPTAQKLKMY